MDFKSLDIKTVEVRSEAEISDKERAIVHYITTTDKDWGGDVVFPEGMNAEMFDKHKTVFYNHDYDKPIGSNMWHKLHENGVLVKTRFAKTLFADDIYMLHKDGIINTWSIGWQPAMLNGEIKKSALEYDHDTKITYIKEWDLVEYSSAPLAMNPSALDQIKTMVKSMELKNTVKDMQSLAEIKNVIESYKKEIDELNNFIKDMKEKQDENLNLINVLNKDVGHLTELITKQSKQAVETLGESLTERLEKRIAGEVSRRLLISK